MSSYFYVFWLFGRSLLLKTSLIKEIDGFRFFFDEIYCGLCKEGDLTGLYNQAINDLRRYESDEIFLIKKHLNPTASVLELGGRLGITSCIVNRILFDSKKHIVLEIESRWKKYLETNRKLNNCSFDIRIGQITNTVQNFDVLPMWRVPQTVDPKLFKFDTLISDIEGAEYSLFEQNSWMFNKLKMVIIELHPPYEKIQFQIEQFLEKDWILKDSLNSNFVFVNF